MGRWRPPPPRSSPYITPAGYATLQDELKGLWLRRRDVVKALADAAAEGDRSENAEYIYRKKELAGIDRRIRYLQKRLPALKVVRDKPGGGAVYFGATVELCDADGAEISYRIVGPDEADASRNAISIDSPMARAMLKKGIDDDVCVRLGDREKTLTVIDIRYDE